MKITPISSSKSQNPAPQSHSDLPTNRAPRKPPRRKIARAPGFSTKKEARRSGPSTPLLRWKFNDGRERDGVSTAAVDNSTESVRKARRVNGVVISVRNLGAALWRFQLPEVGVSVGGGDGERKSEDRLGLKPKVACSGDCLPCHHCSRGCASEAKDLLRSPCSVNGPIKGNPCELQPSFQFFNYAMEGATKWDPVCVKATSQNSNNLKMLHPKLDAASMVSVLQAELEKAGARIQVLETERKSSKKKLEHFLRKLSEERVVWRSKEHEKVRVFIDDIKADLKREKKNRQKLEVMNSKLINELAEAKLSAKRFMQDYEKERKARELIEEVCDELAKEIGEDKAEADAIKKDCVKIREEIEEERKMLQMAEVWREERVQMKLVDAKVTLEDKYSQLNKLMTELENFMRSRSSSADLNESREVEMLRQAAASIKVHDIKEFTYEPSNPEDLLSAFEEMGMAKPNKREIEPCNPNKDDTGRPSNACVDLNGDLDDDRSGWETVSQAEDQGSSYSPEGTAPSVSRMQQDSNFSGSCTDWEENAGDETLITKSGELCSVPPKQLKKVSSISRLWRSCPKNGENYKMISIEGMNGWISNGGIVGPDGGSGRGVVSPTDMVGQWGSPNSLSPHMGRGIKGCIEWPRGTQKNSLKAKLLEARMESQKIQIHQVLKQKI
ncbi:hypothetical protein Nepgr_026826 [Nepenthes gracilis]|uniref:Uncharacterized protein n=1 Tax=Nepenthes gracilis TaxID=150966 RepID=A0AAD3T9A6_NEPGR|nr:hypothetical protein Nepgr_026826 [Nepenthes gracilis]